jgi:hypothetical protein
MNSRSTAATMAASHNRRRHTPGGATTDEIERARRFANLHDTSPHHRDLRNAMGDVVIYHHSITAAAARERVAELISQAARDGGARPKTVRARRRHRWLRVPSRLLMPAARAFKRAAA